MKYFFDNVKRQEQLGRELEDWRGTPFRHHCGVKGKGCDCIYFVVRVLQTFGMLVNVKIPQYPKDWHLHNNNELLLNGIKKHLNIESVGFNNPQNGDIILFQFGKTNSHSSFYYNNYIYHSVTNTGVIRSDWNDPSWHRSKRLGFRLLEKQR